MAQKALDPRLKALIFGDKFKARTRRLSPHIPKLYQSVAVEAPHLRAGFRSWVAICTAATVTANLPRAMIELYKVAIKRKGGEDEVATAEFIREAALKCVTFVGVPRTINCLLGFHERLPLHVAERLCTNPSRLPLPEKLGDIDRRGTKLWRSIYYPYESTFFKKLEWAHPDLPIHVLHNHYGTILSNPPLEERGTLATLGRFLTSIVAVSCLRAQPNLEQQLVAHIFGLKKAREDGSLEKDNPAEDPKTIVSLTSERGISWIIKMVDRLMLDLVEGPPPEREIIPKPKRPKSRKPKRGRLLIRSVMEAQKKGLV